MASSQHQQSAKQRKLASPPAIGFISLGCPKALTDSEVAISQLRTHGYRITGQYEEADIVVINTCGFIKTAEQESFEAIRESIEKQTRVIVCGCLGHKQDLIRRHFPQVLAVTGPHDAASLLAAVQKHAPLKQPSHLLSSPVLPEHGLKLTPSHYAYLKIAEGCNHRCRFCIIPQLRGPLVSRPLEKIEREAASLVSHGCQELLLIAQDSMAYGMDWSAKERSTQKVSRYPILNLIDRLSPLGVWLRLHYVYPYRFVDDLVGRMASGSILPYLDIPLQHSHPRILSAMLRPATSRARSNDALMMLQRIASWRKAVPHLTIRSTFIVGFPGESEAEFEHLLDFIAEAKLDRVGCFTYSAIEGASANTLRDPVPEPIKQERQQRLMKLQEKVSRQRLKTRLGKKESVIVQEITSNAIIARSAHEAPDIDGVIIIPHTSSEISNSTNALDTPLVPGDHLQVNITRSRTHDLHATIISRLPSFTPSISKRLSIRTTSSIIKSDSRSLNRNKKSITIRKFTS